MAHETKTILVNKTVKYNYSCDGCGSALEPIYPDVLYADQCKYALNITLEGGYGMYYDASDVDINLCKDCADKITQTFPFIMEMIEKAEVW